MPVRAEAGPAARRTAAAPELSKDTIKTVEALQEWVSRLSLAQKRIEAVRPVILTAHDSRIVDFVIALGELSQYTEKFATQYTINTQVPFVARVDKTEDGPALGQVRGLTELVSTTQSAAFYLERDLNGILPAISRATLAAGALTVDYALRGSPVGRQVPEDDPNLVKLLEAQTEVARLHASLVLVPQQREELRRLMQGGDLTPRRTIQDS